MRDVAMMKVAAISINEPLLELFAAAYLHGWQQSQCLFEFFLVLSVLTQDARRLQSVRQGIEHNLVVHRASSGNRCGFASWPLLGTHGWHDNKPVFTIS